MTTTTGTELVISGGQINAKAIITCQRGSWRWQNAYSIAYYAPRIRRCHQAGRSTSTMVWALAGASRKLSMPQIRRMGLGDLPLGGMHNQPVSSADLMALSLMAETTGAELVIGK